MLTPINPPELASPKGYSNGMLGPAGGRLLLVAGQIGWDQNKQFVSEDLAPQFTQALKNVLEVVRPPGGGPDNGARLTIYVVDKIDYNQATRKIGESYRELMGRHYPAMALLEVKSLLEPLAKVEIEATAII